MAARDVKDRKDTTYRAWLYRGWDLVRLSYELSDDAMVVRERHIWGGGKEKRVPYDGLSGEVTHVLARQPAYRLAVIIAGLAAMAVAMEFAAAKMMSPGRDFYLPLWITAWVSLIVFGAMMVGTRKRRMWSRFKGKSAHSGAFVLLDPKQPAEHARFVKELKRRAGHAD